MSNQDPYSSVAKIANNRTAVLDVEARPSLTGSKRDIAQAEAARERIVAAAIELKEKVLARPEDDVTDTRMLFLGHISWLLSHTSAEWWLWFEETQTSHIQNLLVQAEKSARASRRLAPLRSALMSEIGARGGSKTAKLMSAKALSLRAKKAATARWGEKRRPR